MHELEGWVAGSVAGRPPPGANAWDGYAASVVCEAGVQALRTGEPTEVRLEARPTLYAATGDLVEQA